MFRPWLHRLTSLALGTWLFTLMAALFWLGVAEGSMGYLTLEELTITQGSTVHRIGGTTFRTYGGPGPLEIQTDFDEYNFFITTVLIGSFLIAFVCGVLTVVVFPHWRRIAYLSLMLCMPVVAAGVTTVIWRYDAPHLFEWSFPYIAAHAVAQLIGGIVAIGIGRPLARLTVRIFLPPTLRPRLAYLWLADRKPFPSP